jgi:hypothetical protein
MTAAAAAADAAGDAAPLAAAGAEEQQLQLPQSQLGWHVSPKLGKFVLWAAVFRPRGVGIPGHLKPWQVFLSWGAGWVCVLCQCIGNAGLLS